MINVQVIKENGPKQSIFYRLMASWSDNENLVPCELSVGINKDWILEHISRKVFTIHIMNNMILGKDCPIEIVQCLYHVVLLDIENEQ
jgi:hypothetical protein